MKKNEFEVLEHLGEGGYGTVELIRHPKWGTVAHKKISKISVSDSSFTTLQNEANIQKNLKHQNIVILYRCKIRLNSLWALSGVHEIWTCGSVCGSVQGQMGMESTNNIRCCAGNVLST